MSIGNLKDQGNQGKNFPWQLRVLQGLQQIYNANDACCGDTLKAINDISTILQGTARTPAIISAVGTSGSTPNAYSVSIANVGSAAGVVNGVSVPAGVTLNFDGGFNNLLAPMSYNASGTTFIITSIS